MINMHCFLGDKNHDQSLFFYEFHPCFWCLNHHIWWFNHHENEVFQSSWIPSFSMACSSVFYPRFSYIITINHHIWGWNPHGFHGLFISWIPQNIPFWMDGTSSLKNIAAKHRTHQARTGHSGEDHGGRGSVDRDAFPSYPAKKRDLTWLEHWWIYGSIVVWNWLIVVYRCL